MEKRELSREEVINILKSRKLITGEGKYSAKVTSVTPYHRSNENGPDQIAIVNFNLMTPYHADNVKTLFAQGDFNEAANQNISTSVRETDYLPVKGEIVEIVIEQITTNNGVTGLFVTGPCIPQKAKSAMAFNLSSLLEETEGTNIVSDEIPAFAKR